MVVHKRYCQALINSPHPCLHTLFHACLQEVDYSANEIEEMPDLSLHQSLQKIVLDGEHYLLKDVEEVYSCLVG